MFAWVLTLVFVTQNGTIADVSDAKLLMETIEALQQPVEDFQCEFEGTHRFLGSIPDGAKAGDGGLIQSFSGVFIWKRDGDTRSESLHRNEADGKIVRKSLLVLMPENRTEFYTRLNDAPLGFTTIRNAGEINSWQPDCLGSMFLIDKLKRDVATEHFEATVGEDVNEGRRLKVLDIGVKGRPNFVLFRYWIDLQRSGHVVRLETKGPGGATLGRWEFRLSSFKVGDTLVWMPVAGEELAYANRENRKVVFHQDPTFTRKIYVVDGTMQFNKRPGPSVFTIKYKPGTPISDNLRKLTYEFGQQTVGSRPKKVEVETMLNDNIAKAQEQKAELVVASVAEGSSWTRWLGWGFGALVVVSSIALWVQRRAR